MPSFMPWRWRCETRLFVEIGGMQASLVVTRAQVMRVSLHTIWDPSYTSEPAYTVPSSNCRVICCISWHCKGYRFVRPTWMLRISLHLLCNLRQAARE